jgi:hypothetical protein
MKPSSTSRTAKPAVIILLLGVIVLLQFQYDRAAAAAPALPSGSSSGVTPFMVQLADMGFHPAVASFIWANVMPSILDLFNKKTEYLSGLAFVNGVDPKLSYPYAFSVLTLPAVPASDYPNGVAESIAIGKEGLANADPDWRIPYYMAMNYYLSLHNEKDALIYFNMAAQTPGVPQFAERFALNFAVGTDQRAKAEALWATIASSTNDVYEQQRAEAYIAHLKILDYLAAASKAYRAKFGVYPTSTQALVVKGIIPAVPKDPFGFTFLIKPDGSPAVNYKQLPAYILKEPAQ